MNHQHGIEKTYHDEELKGSITRKELPMPMGWKVLIQPNQSKSKTVCIFTADCKSLTTV